MNYIYCDQDNVRSEQQEDVRRRKGEQIIHRENEDADGSDHQIGFKVESVR